MVLRLGVVHRQHLHSVRNPNRVGMGLVPSAPTKRKEAFRRQALGTSPPPSAEPHGRQLSA